MASSPLRIALVILEDEAGCIAFQLRSDIEGIANPGHWGLFGGHIELGEEPRAAAVREIKEELSAHVDPAKMGLISERRLTRNKHYYIFHYPVTHELDHAQLAEGDNWAFLTWEQIEASEVEGKPIVAYHRQWLLDSPHKFRRAD
jgi:8-oxo-dGTP diphosphatase